jgi:hypothetical protein
VGATPIETTAAGAFRVTVVLTLAEPSVAVTVTEAVEVTAEAEALKVVLVEPCGTVTDDGIVSAELLSEIATGIPFAGAAELSTTVHVVDPAPVIAEGLQLIEERADAAAEAMIVSVKFTLRPLYEAESVTGVFALTVEAEALKLTLAEPLGIIMEAGVARNVLLPEMATEAPPEGAGPLRDTVQTALLPPETDAGLQLRVESVLTAAGGTIVSVKVTDCPL